MSESPPDYFDRMDGSNTVAVTDAVPVTKIVEGPANPFQRARSEHLSEGAVEIESQRAIAEAQGKLVLAKRFPRDEGLSFDRLIDACSRPGLANVAFYKYGRGGGKVEGPSIRLAEEIQRCWGNMESGLRELSRKPGMSEMEAFAWDYESNNLSTQRFTVRHIRDRTEGNVDLTSERDVYEITANMGQRRVRARILAVIPSDMVEAAIQQCRKTLAGGSKIPLADRIKAAIIRFKDIGVTAEMLASHLGHPLDEITPDEIADLTGVYNSIKEGMSKISDHFGNPSVQPTSKSKLDAFEELHGKKKDHQSSQTGGASPKGAEGGPDQAIGQTAGENPATNSPTQDGAVYAPVRAKTYKSVKDWQKDVMTVIGNLGALADVDELKADPDFVKHLASVMEKAKPIAQEIEDAIEDRVTFIMAKLKGAA